MGGTGRDKDRRLQLGQRLLTRSGNNGFLVILGLSAAIAFEATVVTRLVTHFDGAWIGGVNIK